MNADPIREMLKCEEIFSMVSVMPMPAIHPMQSEPSNSTFNLIPPFGIIRPTFPS